MPNRYDPETAQYLDRVQQVPRLDREQELSLARAYLEQGDLEAKRRVIEANLRHVVPMALRYRHLGVPLTDLIAQGNLGLLAAFERFEPARGLRLSTYASHWVRAEMLQYVLQHRVLVGGGRGPLASKYAFRMRREHALLTAQLGDLPEVLQTLAQRYAKKPEEVAEMLQRMEQRDASIDGTPDREGQRSLGELLSAEQDEHHDDALDRRSYRDELAQAVAGATATLTERERFVVEHRLMADSEQCLSLGDIGKRFGISRERARQIEHAIKQKLKSRLLPVARRCELDSAA
jgi:RNA polymerase sigma-32 factor